MKDRVRSSYSLWSRRFRGSLLVNGCCSSNLRSPNTSPGCECRRDDDDLSVWRTAYNTAYDPAQAQPSHEHTSMDQCLWPENSRWLLRQVSSSPRREHSRHAGSRGLAPCTDLWTRCFPFGDLQKNTQPRVSSYLNNDQHDSIPAPQYRKHIR